MKTPNFNKIIIVMGGGGLRGIAHIGVLKALKELDLYPHEFCGTSVGSLVGACAASGVDTRVLERFGRNVVKNDILNFNFKGILTKGASINSLNKSQALASLIERTVPVRSFKDLKYPLFINTVNINTGSHIVWGLNGMDSAPLHDAVLASCSIPGVFPPVKIGRHYYVDGAVVNNLLLRIGKMRQADLVIAVNLKNKGPFDKLPRVEDKSFMSIIDRADDITSQMVFNANLKRAKGIPLILLQPDVIKRDMFDFKDLDSVVEAGYTCTMETIPDHPLIIGKKHDAINPLYSVDLDKCRGCGLCVMNCDGELWSLTKDNKAKYNKRRRKHCTNTNTCLRNCPYNAIHLEQEGSSPEEALI